MRTYFQKDFAEGFLALTNFPLGLKVVSEKLYRSDAMFGWSQISEMMKMMKKECSPLLLPHNISVTMEKDRQD